MQFKDIACERLCLIQIAPQHTRYIAILWNSSKSPLDVETEDWLLTCWQWLLENVSTAEQVRRCETALPTGDFFPSTEKLGHERASLVFERVAALSGVEEWPFDLVPQEDEFNPVLAPLTVVQNIEPDPLGTFSIQAEGRLTVSYSPNLIDKPLDLIATFIHEISHAILLEHDTEFLGDSELQECATDVTTVLLGFGVFGANCAFEFQQFTGVDTQGWSVNRSGYLTEAEWAFCLALYLATRNESEDELLDWLKPNPQALLKQSMRHLRHHPECLAKLPIS